MRHFDASSDGCEAQAVSLSLPRLPLVLCCALLSTRLLHVFTSSERNALCDQLLIFVFFLQQILPSHKSHGLPRRDTLDVIPLPFSQRVYIQCLKQSSEFPEPTSLSLSLFCSCISVCFAAPLPPQGTFNICACKLSCVRSLLCNVFVDTFFGLHTRARSSPAWSIIGKLH